MVLQSKRRDLHLHPVPILFHRLRQHSLEQQFAARRPPATSHPDLLPVCSRLKDRVIIIRQALPASLSQATCLVHGHFSMPQSYRPKRIRQIRRQHRPTAYRHRHPFKVQAWSFFDREGIDAAFSPAPAETWLVPPLASKWSGDLVDSATQLSFNIDFTTDSALISTIDDITYHCCTTWPDPHTRETYGPRLRGGRRVPLPYPFDRSDSTSFQ